MNTAAVDLSRAAVAYIAAESILPFVSHGMKRCPSKWSVACAITKSAADIGRRAPGQINTSTCRLLIQTTHVQFAIAVSENGHHSCCRSHVQNSRSREQSSLLSGDYTSRHNQQLDVRRCDVHTDTIPQLSRLPNSSSHRASPCHKGRSHLLDPRRISHSRIQQMPPMRQELGPAGHQRDGARGPDGAGESLTLHALPIAGHDVRRPVIGRVRRRRGKHYRDGRAA